MALLDLHGNVGPRLPYIRANSRGILQAFLGRLVFVEIAAGVNYPSLDVVRVV